MRRFGYPETLAIRPPVNTRTAPPTTKTIPFDYVFSFELKGVAHEKVQDVVEISMQGIFVAVALGYSVVPKEAAPLSLPPVIEKTTTPAPHFVPFFDPNDDSFNGMLITGMPGAEIAILQFTPPSIQRTEFIDTRVDGSVNVDFVTLTTGAIPSGTANTLRIGTSGTVVVNFNAPIAGGTFLRIWDRTNNLLSELISVGVESEVVFFASSPPFASPPAASPPVASPPAVSTTGVTPVIGPKSDTQILPAAGDTTVEVYGAPGDNVRLFWFENATGVFTDFGSVSLDDETLFGHRTGHKSINLTAGTVNNTLAPGDVLLVQSSANATVLSFSMYTIPNPRLSAITLGALAAGAEGNGNDLTCGVRINPSAVNFFNADLPIARLAPGTANRIFETCCTNSDEVSFLYSIDILSTGRELQNEPIHNLAGLGIANGDRPFRPLARPIAFEPRSFIRITVEELSCPPGTLYIVLQGYKTLGTGSIPE